MPADQSCGTALDRRLTGLLALHFFMGANQFIVRKRPQRSRRPTGHRGRGFFKLLIPFFSIGAGVAVARLFALRYPPGSTATPFAEIVPTGFAAGLRPGGIGAGRLAGRHSRRSTR